MDHLGVKCSVFYKLQERACARIAADFDTREALDGTDEASYLDNVVRSSCSLL